MLLSRQKWHQHTMFVCVGRRCGISKHILEALRFDMQHTNIPNTVEMRKTGKAIKLFHVLPSKKSILNIYFVPTTTLYFNRHFWHSVGKHNSKHDFQQFFLSSQSFGEALGIL